MGDKTGIEWTDATWNPIVGCSIVSPGCAHCYAMKVAGARTAHTEKYRGLTEPSKNGPVWNGQVRFWEKALLQPLQWKRPRRIFVNSMGDVFHESVPDEWIDKCFAVMALAPQHQFQVLTKRADRMRQYLGRDRLKITAAWGRTAHATRFLEHMHGDAVEGDNELRCRALFETITSSDGGGWPMPNVWLGVSAERQHEAEERIPRLLATPAAIRFLSLEPLLGPITFRLRLGGGWYDPITGFRDVRERFGGFDNQIDWVIVGGESGKHARPMHPDWVRQIRDICEAARVPFLFKQWGEWKPDESADREIEFVNLLYGNNAVRIHRVGKKAAGRLLDGREWNEFPFELPDEAPPMGP